MKLCYIIRGLPGSGKTSFAKNLILRCQDKVKVTHIEADHYMMEGGTYKFDGKKLVDAHKQCTLKFFRATEQERMGDESHLLIVSNTSLALWEFAHYYRMAEVMGWNVRIISLECNSKIAYERQTHDVPQDTFKLMELKFLKGSQDIPKHWVHEIVKN